jgi:hypothetical protein
MLVKLTHLAEIGVAEVTKLDLDEPVDQGLNPFVDVVHGEIVSLGEARWRFDIKLSNLTGNGCTNLENCAEKFLDYN